MDIKVNDPELFNKMRSQFKKLGSDRKNILNEIQTLLDKIESSNLSRSDKKQKTKEIIDLGCFLYYTNRKINIIDTLSEKPDFIILQDQKRIGIELKDLVIRQEEREKEGIIKKLFDDIEKELILNGSKYHGLYEVRFFDDNQSLGKKDREDIKNEIISLITRESSKQTRVKSISKSLKKGVSLYNGVGTCVGNLKKQTVLEKIQSKENRIKDYSNHKYDELWLLLILGGTTQSSDYSFFDQSITNDFFESNFDKIFIYDFSRREITELKLLKK